MKIERRSIRSPHIRVADDDSRTFEAVVMVYDVVDDYETVFDAGCFAASLTERMPRICWAHDWSDPLGRYVDYVDTDETLTLIGEFDDFDAVPRARQAYAQLRSGTIDQFSVGFSNVSTERTDDIVHFTKATLDEASLVLVGAVPGTKLVGVRAAGLVREVPMETVIALAKEKAAGNLTDAEAQAALELAAGTPVSTEESEETVTDAEAVALLDDAAATVAALDV